MEYGYIAGYSNDIYENDSLLNQLKNVLEWGIDPDLIFMDKFTGKCKGRFTLNYLLANVVNEGDIITVANIYNLYSNVRELVSLMYLVEDKGIKLNSNEAEYDANSSIEDWFFACQLSHLEYTSYLHMLHRQKASRKANYQRLINVGGRNKRVITGQYRQAYKYLQSHTYRETEAKFHLSKSTLYRIKQQLKPSSDSCFA
ncbi:recombinase family protein [Limosilactobacillus sp. STM2_1]|uniref:Recombinase family protein n=1 Tax=Limosilactobacillus rudii TaxID=2759755 RepID=A0A7W3UMG8_9LACO|nr:recombinase family protein [Limosilactobacillus rudii]MBB1079271.1 recombinase family protein [Limosilactobacillus rudii]MBB1098269.1 recombinase family protein [Limosilactobacillus rudii]MCD7134341.1 recombinase family protein [Limosilactobacillus rudii]